ncbi:MAG: hypothetical protein R2799_13965 [Crocinitomicaceae bacterium]
MTTDIGIQHLLPIPALDHNGVYELPDGTSRYLINREKINYLTDKHGLNLLDPIKTAVVDKQRSMATSSFSKKIENLPSLFNYQISNVNDFLGFVSLRIILSTFSFALP